MLAFAKAKGLVTTLEKPAKQKRKQAYRSLVWNYIKVLVVRPDKKGLSLPWRR
jgi:hypothetical protein